MILLGVLNPGLAYIREEEERRQEDDGVCQGNPTPDESRSYCPTPSDIKFREQLKKALQVCCFHICCVSLALQGFFLLKRLYEFPYIKH